MDERADWRSKLRRGDRQVSSEDWIKDILRYEPYCTVATSADDQPFIRPSAFFYDESDHALYIHGAHTGRGFDNLQANPKVCVCVFVVGAMRGHRRAFEFFLEQAGVIVFGAASEVTDNEKKHEVMQGLFEKHAPHLTVHGDYEPASQAEIDETTVVRLDIETWSGKMKWTDDEPIFRFDYEDVRGDRRAALPWNGATEAPLTSEWRRSLGS